MSPPFSLRWAAGCRAHDSAMIDRRSFRGGTVCGLSQRDAAACIFFCCVHLVSTSSIGMPFSCRRLAECLLQSAAGLGTWPALSEGCGSRFGALAMRLRRRVYPGCSPFSFLMASALPQASAPLPAAWRFSPREKPRVAHAPFVCSVVPSRSVMRASWLVLCAAPEELRGEPHCGYGSALHAGL